MSAIAMMLRIRNLLGGRRLARRFVGRDLQEDFLQADAHRAQLEQPPSARHDLPRDLIRSLAGNHTIVLSTHILPEVSQTCQRVVIINKGKVVAVDTPDNLTARLSGAETLYVHVEAPGADPGAVLEAVPGVTRVGPADMRPGSGIFEVQSERGRDVRREIAREVVTRGWGLLELRPMRISLEEVFLQVTTEETPEAPPAGSGPVLSEGGARAEGDGDARVEGEAPNA